MLYNVHKYAGTGVYAGIYLLGYVAFSGESQAMFLQTKVEFPQTTQCYTPEDRTYM
jgi:hypothetical protein